MTTLKAIRGDITKLDVDVIVNAANATLLGGGGVDGAIHFKGGPQILEECREIRRTRFPHGLPTGEAVLTTAGNLPARYVTLLLFLAHGLIRNSNREGFLWFRPWHEQVANWPSASSSTSRLSA